ncbi:MAG: M20 metallopeptidase family protein [Fusobacteriaceae bacterium]
MNEFLVKTREDLHRIPEISRQEFKTANYIRTMLKSFNINFVEIGTSTVGLISGESDIWIAYRADIDALKMEEQLSVPYKSQHEGIMHSCGHDGHTANLLYFAKYLSEEIKKGVKLKKSVMLIFQCDEEISGGAKDIAYHEVYAKKNIEAVIGLHVVPHLEEGMISSYPGVWTAQNISFEITITGKKCYGAHPYDGVDSILLGARLIESYHTIISRDVPSDEQAILSIGSFQGGDSAGIIPEKVFIKGIIKLFNKKYIEKIQSRLEAINKGLEISYGAKINMDFKLWYPSMINDEKLFDILKKHVPKEKFPENCRTYNSEDFSYYTEAGVPGLFFELGVGNSKKGFTEPLHTQKFDFDPNVLEHGFEVFKNFLFELKVI